MNQRKYMSEMAFHLVSQGVLIFHPKDIDTISSHPPEVRNLADDCHIYLIAKRPRLTFVPNSIVSKGGVSTGKLHYRAAGEQKEVRFELRGESNCEIDYGEYPHRTITFRKQRKVVATVPAHLISLISDGIECPEMRDAEVAYVGMAYGDGSRSATDRLKSHSTLQKVLADMSVDEPDSEALLVLVQYAAPMALICINGQDTNVRLEEDRDVMGDLRQHQELINERTEIALAEAGLIKYFRPRYNQKYKNFFPNKSHTISRSLYDVDFNAFVVELNTEDVNLRLFSQERAPGFHHIASYDLHDPEVRKSIFDLTDDVSGTGSEVYSGPLF